MWPESLRYLVLGAGGGGRTVAGILERALATEGIDAVAAGAIAFVDDRHPGSVVNGHRVIGTMADARQRLRSGSAPQHAAWIVAFGTTFMAERRRVFEEWRQAGARLFNAVDPSAAVDRTARIGVGNVVAAQSVIHPNAVVGDNCFLCAATTVDHDTIVADHAYCSPGVNLAGAAIVEEGVFLGTNATVLPGVRVGRYAVVGAGAVVLKDVPAGATAVGNPARLTRHGGTS